MNQTSTLTDTSDTSHQQYPWLIAISGLFILITINGLTTSSLSVFDEVVQREFHLTRSVLKSRETVTYAVSALFILLSGWLIDRIGVKKLLLSGLTLMALALGGYGFARNLTDLYILHVLLGLAYVSAGSVAVVILVSSWFQKKRGLALGITLAGTSLGSAIFPPLLTNLIHTHGWREAFHWLSFVPLVLFVYTAVVVHSTPETAGMQPYGRRATEEPLVKEGRTYAEALHTPLFWLIALCGFLSFLGIVGLVSNLFLQLRSVGFDSGQAAWTLSLYFTLALVGKFLISWISDLVSLYPLFTGCLLGLMVGAIGLASLTPSLIIPSVGLAALSWGGVFTLYNVLIVRSFGLKAAGKINGTISLFENCGSLLGPLVMGWLFETSGSYQQPLYLTAGVFGLTAFLSLLFFRRVPKAYVS
ncbi:MFS transporter [Siphonobacter sp.]|uniref:MFS transporter n=1 Tax=Siphonobacter sp. TaxID=1869184 RepID=UPI003B3A6229